MVLWLCFCVFGLVVVFLGFCGGVVVFLGFFWWCGGVFVLVWLCFVFLCFCGEKRWRQVLEKRVGGECCRTVL